MFVSIDYRLLVQRHINIKDCFEINGKQRIIMPKNGEYVKI